MLTIGACVMAGLTGCVIGFLIGDWHGREESRK